MPDQPDHVPIDIDDLTFGVELEVIMPRNNSGDEGRRALAVALGDVGLVAVPEIYNHNNRPHWKIITDNSIGYANSEVVSPILRAPSGFADLGKAADAIDRFGCRVNRSTGFHVHVGVRDRFSERVGFFKELVRTYAKFEPILDSLVAPSRRASMNAYCGTVRYTPSLDAATTVDALRRAYGWNRFVKLNLEAFEAHGTVEFRQHQGTTNAQKIENWVRLCLRLVAHAARNDEPSREPAPRPTAPIVVRDYARAPRLRGEQIPRFVRANSWDLRNMVIVSASRYTRRRAGTAGRENHDLHNIWAADRIASGYTITLADYHRHGGARTHLAWDVDHAYVGVVRASEAPPLEAPPPSTTTASPVSRPPTDAAPATLDGLLTLVEATDAEARYFVERQMELNG